MFLNRVGKVNMKTQKILTKNRWGIVDTTIQITVTFVNDDKYSSLVLTMANFSVAVTVAKSIIPFPSMQARLLKTRRKNPKPWTKRQGPTFSKLDIPKLPDNNDMQKFNVDNKGKELVNPPDKVLPKL